MEAFLPGAVGPKIGCVALDAGWQLAQGSNSLKALVNL